MEKKIPVPINEKMASKLVSEYPNLTGVIETTRTVFYSDGEPIFEMTKTFDKDRQDNWVSYLAYLPAYKQAE